MHAPELNTPSPGETERLGPPTAPSPPPQGTEGVALVDAPDRGPGPPPPRAFGTVEAVAAAASDPAAQLHFDLPSALAGPPDALAAHPRWAELRASGAGLEGVAAFDAAASEAVAQLLCALRPFSYG